MTKTPYVFDPPLEEGVIRKRKTQFTMIRVVQKLQFLNNFH
jgi:hypothetical protein